MKKHETKVQVTRKKATANTTLEIGRLEMAMLDRLGKVAYPKGHRRGWVWVLEDVIKSALAQEQWTAMHLGRAAQIWREQGIVPSEQWRKRMASNLRLREALRPRA